MAANMRFTRVRLSATAWGLRRSSSFQAVSVDAIVRGDYKGGPREVSFQKMPEIIWFNGRIMPLAEARVSVEDRGFQFADGVYEAMRLYHGRPFALEAHLERLERSAAGIKLGVPIQRDELARQIQRLIDQSGVREGMLYLQLTRGVCPR